MRKVKINFCICLVFFFVESSFNSVIAQENKTVEEKNILVLHSYHQGLEWSDNISKGIQSVFKETPEINLIFEYLDTKRNYKKEYFNALKAIYKTKAEQIFYDVIITCDNAAFDFMRMHSQEFYSGVPVVYCGVNNLEVIQLKENPNFFGFNEKVDHMQTIESIIKVFPERKNVLIINDNTKTGQAIYNELITVLPHFNGRLNFEVYSDFNLEKLKEKVIALDESYAIYLLVVNRDKDGNFISYARGISAIQEVSKVPIFGSWDFYEDKGLFGGKITRGFDQGESAASLAMEILENGVTENISQLNKVKNNYVFDYKEMSKFNVSIGQLPSKSLVINEGKRKEYILKLVILLSLGILLLIIIILSIRLWIKKRRAKLLQLLVDKKTIRLRETNLVLKDIITKKDKFLAIMSHDLKGPFNSMLGFAEILNSDFDTFGKPEQKKFIGIIYQGIQNTYKLLENLLSWSHTQSGAMEFELGREDLHTLTNEIIDVLRFSADQKAVSVVNKIPESTFVIVDRNMLSTIIRNLVSNAIKFTPRQGNIIINSEVVVDKDDIKSIKVSVKDNGVGMTKEAQKKLFDIGQVLSTNGTEDETGTGLGLILCQEFVGKHKGKIWVESCKGVGSKFMFTLPIKES